MDVSKMKEPHFDTKDSPSPCETMAELIPESSSYDLDLVSSNKSASISRKARRAFSEILETDVEKNGGKCVLIDPLNPNYVAEISSSFESNNTEEVKKYKTQCIFVIVIPGIDLDQAELKRLCQRVEVYEERQLYHLLLLDNPDVHVIYVSTRPVANSFVRYTLSLRQQEEPGLRSKLARLFMFSPNVGSNETEGDSCMLGDNILSNPRLVNFVKEVIHGGILLDKGKNAKKFFGGISTFVGTKSLHTLSSTLGVPLLEASIKHSYWGTKQGSRELFRICGLPLPGGTPDVGDDDLLTTVNSTEQQLHLQQYHKPSIRTSKALATGLARQVIRHANPSHRFVCKLNLGFSGKGNAILDLSSLADLPGSYAEETETLIDDMAEKIENLLPKMSFVDTERKWDGNDSGPGYREQIQKLGVIAESFLEGTIVGSPSVQGIVSNGSCEIISSHDQILDNQVYEGCRFPASSRYRSTIIEYGKRTGAFLAKLGVIGHFSLDFVAIDTPSDAEHDKEVTCYAIEINLRQGGTTHPFALLQLLTGGQMKEDGTFVTPEGQQRFYVATDTYFCPNLVGVTESRFLQTIERSKDKFKWNQKTKSGAIFHLVKPIMDFGKVGFTAIGSSIEEAEHFFEETKKFCANSAFENC